MAQNTKSTGWLGWIYFAGVLMMLVGIFQTIAGLVAIFQDDVYLVSANSLVLFDYSQWGWVHFTFGLVLFFTSFSLLAGQTWGRILGVFLAVLSAVANFAFLPAYPIWSTLVIVADVLIIYAITAHGREARV